MHTFTDQQWLDYINEEGIDNKERNHRYLIYALKLALPCVEYAEIATAAEGQTEAHEKCLKALNAIRPSLLSNGAIKLSREVDLQKTKDSLRVY
jgi:hypothetical protein